MRVTALTLALGSLLVTGNLIAQPKEVTKFFPAAAVTSGGTANVQYLVGGYIAPLAEDLGGLINSGWYSTAENHKRFGFDLSVNMSTIFIEDQSKFFQIDNTQLTGIGYLGTVTGNQPMATAYGPESEVPTFTYNGLPNAPGGFNGPGGGNVSKDIPIGSMAIPTIQGGLGLFANTDLRFRFTPATTINGTEVKAWGVGVLHDIKQHIAGIKELPFSLSLLLAYSNMTVTTDLGGLYETTAGSGSYAGQQGLGETTAFNAQVLISKQIPVLTFYGGLGYNSSTTTYSIKGDYYVDHAYLARSTPLLVSPVSLKDPYKQEFTASGFRFTGGIRFKFGPIFLNTDYTFFRGEGLMSLGLGATVR
jgi:hypothetical protein